MTNGPYPPDFMYILVISKCSSYMQICHTKHNSLPLYGRINNEMLKLGIILK